MTIVPLLLSVLLTGAPGPAQTEAETLPGPVTIESLLAKANDERPAPKVTVRRGIRYTEREGTPGRRTSLDIHRPDGLEGPAPILIFVHGGGWAIGDKALVNAKPHWAARNGWILVSVNYRFSPSVEHPEHARDVAAAVAWVHQHAAEFGGDPERIALIGHSAGAHLAAIVGCEESLLGEVGMTTDQLAGIVLLDGAGYNLPRRMTTLPKSGQLRDMYHGAFGADPDLWERASPTLQAGPEDALPALFAVHAGLRVESRVESRELAEAWRASGARAEVYHARRKDHGGINKQLGQPDDEDTPPIEAFLRSVFGQDDGAVRAPGAD